MPKEDLYEPQKINFKKWLEAHRAWKRFCEKARMEVKHA